MALRVTVAPTDEPVSLVEAKAHLRVTESDEDDLIEVLIVAAREAAEHKTGRALMPQTLLLTLDAFPVCKVQYAHPVNSSCFRLLRAPITAVSWVKYYDTTGTLTTLSSAAYTTDFESEPGRICPAYGYSWPQTYERINAVSVQYTAGYTNAAAVPQGIKSWILLRLAAMYENREEVTTEARAGAVAMPFMDSLLDRYWVPEIG